MEKTFKKIYKIEFEKSFFSPGRVNLIGEHIDYNGGYVLPCALDIGTYGLVSIRNDREINFYSMNFENTGIIKTSLDDLSFNKSHYWANYLKGVLFFIKEKYSIDYGLNILINGNIPNGAGLSSSASVEVLMATIVNDIYNLKLDRIEIIKLCQKAENEYIGVNCGIMDQFAIGMCEKNHGIMINTNTLAYEQVYLNIDGYKIIICDTKVKRGLTDSKYNERRRECNKALEILNKKNNLKFLCDGTLDMLEASKKDFLEISSGKNLYNRAKHAISENIRTIKAKDVLINGNIVELGKLMDESHKSLKYDYEVSCVELDKMVELGKKYGAIGSRMTGAGFGGCTVNIVPEEKVLNFSKEFLKEYKEKTGLDGDVYIANSGGYAKNIILN